MPPVPPGSSTSVLKGATIRYTGVGGGLGRSNDKKCFILHLREVKIFFSHFLKLNIYMLGVNIFFSIFEEEFINFNILPSHPACAWISKDHPLIK